jgi:hypothetical protein
MLGGEVVELGTELLDGPDLEVRQHRLARRPEPGDLVGIEVVLPTVPGEVDHHDIMGSRDQPVERVVGVALELVDHLRLARQSRVDGPGVRRGLGRCLTRDQPE